MKIYVASSWRNTYQQEVVYGLRELDHEVYDFRNPAEGNHGFHWSAIDPFYDKWSVSDYLRALSNPVAEAGFKLDFDAMQWADACVLVMPCGRSAHLEAGWFVGTRKPLLILASEAEPELMYKLADSVHIGLGTLSLRLQNLEDTAPRV